MKLSLVRVVLICLLVFTMQRAVAQEQKLIPRTSQEAEQTKLAERRISLDVVAADAAGNAISGLQQQDFTIWDNNKPQQILSFAALEGAKADPPDEVILLVDLVNTSFQRVAYERDAVARFFRQNNGQLAYPVTLVVFTDKGTQIQPQPSRDGNALAELLASNGSSLRIIGRSTGVYGAAERLQLSLQTLNQLIDFEGKKPGRKMLVWISPGWPMLAGPGIQFDARQQQSFFNWIALYSNGLRTSRITLYAVDPLGTDASMMRSFYYQSYLKGVRKVDQANSGNLALQVLATQSGGRVFNANNDLLSEINACIADAAAYYVMSFDAAPTERANEYHALTVKIGKPGVTARTNYAYYGEP